MIALIAPILGQMIKDVGDGIQTETYDNPENTLKMGAEFGELIVKHAREASIDAAFPLFLSGLFNRGVSAGYGGERTPAMIKVLRAGGV